MNLLNAILQGTSNSLRELFADTSMLPLALLFTAVFIGVLAVPRLVNSRNPVQRRLAPTGVTKSVEGAPRLRPGENSSLWGQILNGLEKRAIPVNEKQRTTARVRLMQAGYVGTNAVRDYFASRLLLAVILPLGFIALAPIFTRNLPIEKVIVITVCLLVAGLYLPSVWVSNRVRARQLAVQCSKNY